MRVRLHEWLRDISIEDLKPTGEVSEGQNVERWEHRPGSTIGIVDGGHGRAEAIRIAKDLYQKEALKPYREAIKPIGLRP